MSSYCNTGEWEVEIIEVCDTPLFLLKVALIHRIQEDPMKSVQKFGLCRSKIVDGFFSERWKVWNSKSFENLNRCSFVFECKQNKF